MFVLVLTAVVAAVSGAVVGLKLLAPVTKSKADDKLLAFLEKAEPLLDVLLKK